MAKSGWCLDSVSDHERCRYDACTCPCHGEVPTKRKTEEET